VPLLPDVGRNVNRYRSYRPRVRSWRMMGWSPGEDRLWIWTCPHEHSLYDAHSGSQTSWEEAMTALDAHMQTKHGGWALDSR
jgi:hypothetical protein